ncbi:MAG: twin-arginine translocation signal domain-containing protein [Comamonadaceae bacterium]|nr:twin-arginine translocation signal domain-containing protein [Comamonadaceae bacterium]
MSRNVPSRGSAPCPRSRPLSRRHFLRAGAAAAAALTVVPRRVLGGPGYLAPSDTLTKAVIGVGGMGRGHLGYEGSVLRAVCDVDRGHLGDGPGDRRARRRRVRRLPRGPGPAGHRHRPHRDAAPLARPDLRRGGRGRQGRLVREADDPDDRRGPGASSKPSAARAASSASTPGSASPTASTASGPTSSRSRRSSRAACWAGRSRPPSARTTGFDWKFYWSGLTDARPEPVPPELDYDFWLGPAPWKPYHPHRVHGTFRGYWDYDGGGLGDMGMHYLDPVQYLLDKDDTSPVEVAADCPQQHPDACGAWRRDRADVRRRLRHRPRRREPRHRGARSSKARRASSTAASSPTSRACRRSSPPCPIPSRRSRTSPSPSGRGGPSPSTRRTATARAPWSTWPRSPSSSAGPCGSTRRPRPSPATRRPTASSSQPMRAPWRL